MLFKNILIAPAFALLSGTVTAEEVGDGGAPKLNVGSLNLHKRDAPNGLRARNPILLDNLEGLVLADSSTPAAIPTGSSSSFSHIAQPTPTWTRRRQKRNLNLLSGVGSVIRGLDHTSSTSASPSTSSNSYNYASKPSHHSMSRERRAMATPTATPSSVPIRSARASPTSTPRPSMMRRVKLT